MLILFHLLIVFHWRVLSYKIIHLCQLNNLYYQVEIVYLFYIDLPILNTLSIGTYSFISITCISLTSISFSFHYIKIFHLLLVLILVVLDHSILSLLLLSLQIHVLLLLLFALLSDSLQLKNHIISQLNPIVCSSQPLVISSNSNCYKINQNGWTSITVNEGYCNDITSDINISYNPCLQSIVVKKRAFMNVNSLTISNNPLLQTIETDGTIEYNTASFRNIQTTVVISSITHLIEFHTAR